jgi:LuxR family quorum sensing-dependent transcriptional regulator
MDRFRYAKDEIEIIKRLETPDLVVERVAKTAASFGFQSCAITALPIPERSFEAGIVVHRWPDGWHERYIKQCYNDFDPVLKYAQRSLLPFMWSDAVFDREKDPLAALMMNEASDFGLAVGFTIPTQTIRGETFITTFGGERCEFSAEDQLQLHLITIYAQARVATLHGATFKTPKLTSKELEVLKWCHAGKTSSEIGQIMAISDRTVNFHVQNICRKLDVVSRQAAIAKSIRAGLIL